MNPDTPDEREASQHATDARLTALEAEVAELRLLVVSLKGAQIDAPAIQPERKVSHLSDAQVRALRLPPPSSPPPSPSRVSEKRQPVSNLFASANALHGDNLESFIGRYVAVALGALVMLMAVGAMIRMAVQHGLLTPAVRIAAGAATALALAIAGGVFRRRGDRRYGGVLLALALAVTDLVAWGAGPKFGLIPTSVALGLVDVCSLLLAALALADESEFLFAVALGGALSAPFVTSNGGGSAVSLLTYAAIVLAGALRSAQRPEWTSAFLLMIGGAFVYAVAAAQLPVSREWYGPFCITLFSMTCVVAALTLAESSLRSLLARGYVASMVIGALVSGNASMKGPLALTIVIAVLCALLTYCALFVRENRSFLWLASALALPLISLAIAAQRVSGVSELSAILALWSLMAFGAWRIERERTDVDASGAHLLLAGLLGAMAVTRVTWSQPLALVAGLAGWAVLMSVVAGRERSTLSLLTVGIALGAAVLSSLDQLLSRAAYSYTPFITRSSASAACVAAGIAMSGYVLADLPAGKTEVAGKTVRIGALVGFLILWGRMEVAEAYSHDIAAFLLASYYALCGVALIVSGRRYSVAQLRIAGLCLVLYAALLAVVEVTGISSLLLRVGGYGAVAVLLLGAGYLYRNASLHDERGLQQGV